MSSYNDGISASASVTEVSHGVPTTSHITTLEVTDRCVHEDTGEIRKVSSVIIDEQHLEQPPEDIERYVEVPTYEEQVKYVPVREVREVEKRVNVPVVEVVERIKEIRPAPVYKDVEKIEYYDVPVEVKVPQYCDRVVEKIVEKRVPQTKTVYKEVEVPEYVDKEEIYYVDVPVDRAVYVDEEVPVIVSQVVKPVITESSSNFLDVNVVDYEPEIIPVDVHVAKPVESSVEAAGIVSSRHKLVNITSAQYNTILRSINTHLDEKARQQLPYVSENKLIHFAADDQSRFIVAPSDIDVEGYKFSSRSTTTHVHPRHTTSSTAEMHKGTSTTINSTTTNTAVRTIENSTTEQQFRSNEQYKIKSHKAHNHGNSSMHGNTSVHAVEQTAYPSFYAQQTATQQSSMQMQAQQPPIAVTATAPYGSQTMPTSGMQYSISQPTKKSGAMCCNSGPNGGYSDKVSSSSSSASSSSSSSSGMASQKHHHIRSAGKTYSSVSSHHVDTIHSYRNRSSNAESRPVQRSRVCC